MMEEGQSKERRDNAIKTAVVTGFFQKFVIDEAMETDIVRGNKTAVTYGIVRYDDVFGEHHWTKYCMRMVVRDSLTDSSKRASQWGTCETGNEIDALSCS